MRPSLILVIATLVPSIARPIDVETVHKNLEQARNSHRLKIEKLREAVTKDLENASKSARVRGLVKEMDMVAKELEHFRATGKVPSKLVTRERLKQYESAYESLAKALAAGSGELLRLMRDDEARKVDAELGELRKSYAATRNRVPETATAAQDGKSYQAFDRVLTWKEAQQACVQMGGHLPIIRTEAEDRLVRGLMEAAGLKQAWLGATDEIKEGQWRWIDGTEMTYTNWAKDQPNDANFDGTGEDYLVSQWDGKWWDFPNRGQAAGGHPGFVCEWGVEARSAKRDIVLGPASKASQPNGPKPPEAGKPR